MTSEAPVSTSTAYFGGSVNGDYRHTGAGKEIFPNYVSEEEWQAAGAEVQDIPYDVTAVSITDNRPGQEKDVWSVRSAPWMSSQGFEIDKVPAFPGFGNRPEQYRQLVADIEQHLGRTGLTILVF